MEDATVEAIHLLGAAGIQVVRLYVDSPPGIRAEIGEGSDAFALWRSKVGEIRAQLRGDWDRLELSALLDADQSEPGTSDAAVFGDKVSAYVQSIAEVRGWRWYGVGSVARRLADVQSYQSEPATMAALEESLNLLQLGVRTIARSAPPQTLEGLVGDVVMVGSTEAYGSLRPAVEEFTADLVSEAPASYTERLLIRADDAGWTADGIDDVPGVLRQRLAFRAAGNRPDLPSQPAEPLRTDTFVNIGVATMADATLAAPPESLAPDDSYWLWVSVGPRAPDAVVGDTTPLPVERFVEGEELEIVLFPDAEVELDPSQSSGRLRMTRQRTFDVIRAAAKPPSGEANRLYFSLRTPATAGTWRVRCAVIARGVILHVEQLTILVGTHGTSGLEIDTTYSIARDLTTNDGFAGLETPALSIYANASGSTHDFSFYLPGDTKGEQWQAKVDSQVLMASLDKAREALGKASWGSEEPFRFGVDTAVHDFMDGRFKATCTGGLHQQLIDLAIVGSNLWRDFASTIENSPAFAKKLRNAMRTGGAVQLAPKEFANDVMALQLLYDFRLHTAQPSALRLCAASQSWLATPNAPVPCIGAVCPDESDWNAVCIAGFWGFRHAVTICPSDPDACGLGVQPVLPSAEKPITAAALATDEKVAPHWVKHATALGEFLELPAQVAQTAEDAIAAMTAEPRPVLAYFLTHVVDGSQGNGLIRFGFGDEAGIDGNDLDEIELCPARPLVVLNACESAALSPKYALGLVRDFQRVGASGVVGTEVTIFVTLAVAFGERFLAAFANRIPLAEAMRVARLEVLGLGNPLGLAYASYGLHSLQLASVEMAAGA